MPTKNIIFERYMFKTAVQEEENIDGYPNRLRKLASTCEFGNLSDQMICDRLVIGIKDHNACRRILHESELTLAKALDMLRRLEQTAVQMKTLDGEAETSVHVVQSKQGPPKPERQKRSEIQNCGFCRYKHRKGKCPAYGKIYNKCGRRNHFASECKADNDSESTQIKGTFDNGAKQ